MPSAWRHGPHNTDIPWKNVIALSEAGYVPVMHGDVVLGTHSGPPCGVDGGDAIMADAASALPLAAAVFVSKEDGLLCSPPKTGDPLPPLIRGVVAAPGAAPRHILQWSTAPAQTATAVDMHTADHDVTGGIAAKVQAASTIAFASSHFSFGTPAMLVGVSALTAALAAMKSTPQTAAETDASQLTPWLQELASVPGTLVVSTKGEALLV